MLWERPDPRAKLDGDKPLASEVVDHATSSEALRESPVRICLAGAIAVIRESLKAASVKASLFCK